MTSTAVSPWWQTPGVLERCTRDALISEMAALRPGGWAWPGDRRGHGHGLGDRGGHIEGDRGGNRRGDVHLVEDAHADSLEMMALHSAWAEQWDLRDESLLQQMMDRPSWQNWTAVVRARLAQNDTAMRFATSGSTGRAQRVVHRRADLCDEVQCIAQRLRTQGPSVQRVVSTVRAHHIYGFLFTVLLPIELGHLPVVDAVGLPPALVRQGLQPRDLVVAFPDWWVLATRDGGQAEWPEGITGVSSTAPCPAAVAHAALACGVARWVEVYGSTETAGVGWREHPDQPFELQPYWQVDQSAEEPVLRRVGLNGGMNDLRKPTPTPDHLEWITDRLFRPLARRDGVVQVGGTNVSPAWVAQQLLKHPAVAEVVVRPITADGPARLKAFVVPHASDHSGYRDRATSPATEADLGVTLLAWCRQHLPPAARPVDIRIGPQLPRNDMGKLCDW